MSNKQKEDEAGSVTSKGSSDRSDKLIREKAPHTTTLIPKLLNHPPYVTIASSNQIVGNFGHASVILKHPII